MRYFIYGALGLALMTFLFLEGAPVMVPPLPIEEVLSSCPSPVVTDRTGNPLWVGLNGEEQVCMPLSLDLMGKWLPRILIEVEDRRFERHGGVDWLGLIRALWQNLSEGRIVSGGSTITSQLIRMSFPRERTLGAKAVEFLQAMALERMVDKRTILESYLNKAPFGGNLQGVAAGTLGWWGKKPSELSLSEAVTLVAMLKGPTRYRPDLFPDRIKNRRDMILSDLASRGVISDGEAALAMSEPLPGEIGLPREEFLFVSQFLLRHPEGGRSSLDPSVQALAARSVSSGLKSMPLDVTSSAVVVENETGSVRAYVGNGRFGEPLPWGWVDCGASMRSPGSALKPFVYAMAMDDGLLSPSSLMADTPLSMAGRAPRNFDLRYRGPVSMAQALSQSLNVPAVRALRSVGVERFLYRLRSLGFSGLKGDGAYYGDSLVLGGCEVSPLEMARAYMIMASWRDRELCFLDGSGEKSGPSPFSQESSFLIGDILRDLTRLSPEARRLVMDRAEFAFKTGTSYGLRDAWAVGWNGKWTVVVWMGDPSGTPHAELIGLSAAVPVIVDIISMLGGEMPLPPDGVAKRTVCSLSGLPPNSACPHRTEAWYIPGVSPSGHCAIHRWQGGRVVTVLPGELAHGGDEVILSRPFRVVSPLEGASYILPPWGDPPRIPLSSEGFSGRVWWFVDGVFLGETSGERPLFWRISGGRHRIGAVDESGRSHWITVTVSEGIPCD